ncbi:MAG TPA: hypothetical protein VL137_15420 [Polyangiaceae bacterium]|nr:hypothetical protein [Polyangiaceae bacterium]
MMKLRSASWAVVAVGLNSLGFCMLGCSGSSGSTDHVLTPDERLNAEEKEAYQSEQAKKKRQAEEGEEPIDETPAPKPFDQKHTEMELERATRNAESCTGVVTDSKERGATTVSLVFSNEGKVSQATIPPPFEGTRLGDCVLNAYKAVLVPPFDGSDHPMTWDLTLKDPPDQPAASTKKKTKK